MPPQYAIPICQRERPATIETYRKSHEISDCSIVSEEVNNILFGRIAATGR